MKPKEFDSLCQQYVDAQLVAESATQSVDAAKARVIAAVEENGYVPTNAEASRRIDGADFCATVTTATGIEIRDEVCTELELALAAAKRPGVFAQLFQRRVEYTLLKGAEHVLPAAKLPKGRRARIVALYAQCFTPKKKTPSLKVESIADRIEREAKAAKKAGKKGGRA